MGMRRHESPDHGTALAFERVTFAYPPQGADGRAGAPMS